MNSFEEAALRLKQQLKVAEDKQVAEALGLTADAWVKRKKRDAFPTKEVFALAAQHPELGLDPDWVVTGTSNQIEAQGKGEAVLLQHYRLMNPQTAKMFLKIAAAMSGVADVSSEEISKRLNRR